MYSRVTINKWANPYGDITRSQYEKSYEFSHKFIDPFFQKSGITPTFNPFEGLVLKLNKRTVDVYKSVTGFRGFLVSERLLEILLKFRMPDHVLFNNIECKQGNATRNDYHYVHFVESCSDHLDFRKSSFMWVSDEDHYYINNIVNGIHQFNTLQKIKVRNFEEFEQISAENHNKQISLRPEILTIKGNYFDLVTIYYFSENQYFISEEMKKALDEQKIKGFDFAFPHFTIAYVGE